MAGKNTVVASFPVSHHQLLRHLSENILNPGRALPQNLPEKKEECYSIDHNVRRDPPGEESRSGFTIIQYGYLMSMCATEWRDRQTYVQTDRQAGRQAHNRQTETDRQTQAARFTVSLKWDGVPL
jgi:hypothetical protein